MKKELPAVKIKIYLISIIFIVLFSFSVRASYIENVPVKLVQPDGTILNCLATGDEFHNWLHDSNNYTIVKNPVTGYYVYAILVDNKMSPSIFIAGRVDPASQGIVPGINMSEAEVNNKTQRLLAESAIQSNQRTTQVNAVRPSLGLYNNLVIFISFSDQEEIADPMATFTSQFNALGSNSVRDFYKEVSNNQLDVVSTFYPVSSGIYPVSYHDSHPRSYYTKDASDGYANASPTRTVREHTLLVNAVKYVQNQVPAGLLIDGNNDGNVDNVVFVVNGYVEAWNDLLWPHRSSLSSQTVKINNRRVYDYNLVLTEAMGVGTLCHELFHSFGAPDLYHYTQNYPITPVGNWDVMAVSGSTPRHMTVYMKQRYGHWVDSVPELKVPGRYSLAPLSRSPYAAYRISLPGTDEFIMLEYRKKEGRYESSLTGDEGLLIYRINPNYNGNSKDGSGEVYVYRPNGSNATNGNLNQAAFSLNKSRTRFDDYSNPGSFLTDGSLAGLPENLGITNVSVIGDVISFDYKGGSANKLPAVSITSPINNATFASPAEIGITANVSDADGTISKVDFYNGSVLLGTDLTAPYICTWTVANASGTYSIHARATDNQGATNTSLPVSVKLTAAPCKLTGAKVQPSNLLGTSDDPLHISDQAFDGDINTYFDTDQSNGSWIGLDLADDKVISGIRFYPAAGWSFRMPGGKFQASSDPAFTEDVVDLYTIKTLPPTSWNCITLTGTASYRYVRYLSPDYSYGNVAEIEFYTEGTVNTLPVVNITSPSSNELYTGSTGITITADADDADGIISKVMFYNGTFLLGTDETAPYSFRWNAIAAGNYTLTAKAVDDMGGVATSPPVTVLVTNKNALPVVSIVFPDNSANYYTAPATMPVIVSASDPDGTITKVEFYNGASLLGTDNTSPYSFIWQSVGAGTYTIIAKATDNTGATASSSVTVVVKPAPNKFPVISITSPAKNAGITLPATINITADASDPDGSVAKVEFYADSVLLGIDNAYPYTYAWINAVPGNYVLTASVTDNSSAVVTSAAVSITVISMEDIIGGSCVQIADASTFSLNAANRNGAINYNWWFTGSIQSITPVASEPYRVTVNYGSSFSGGELCVGVNYNIAPWYKQYCKNVTACPANINAFRMDETEAASTIVSPNPSTENFKVALKKPATLLTVSDSKGVSVKHISDASGTVELGNDLLNGIYTISIVYTDNTTENIRVVKIK